MKNHIEHPHWAVSCLPLVFLAALLVVVIHFFGSDSLEGGSQVALLLSAGLAIAIGIFGYGQSWKSFEKSIDDCFSSVATSILILLLIGAVAGSWMISGIVPTLVCYGLQIISPRIFLFASCAIAAAVALMTGSSWTTIATVGVALMAIGTALGFSPGWTAGAIISGAYFGDKVSPLSDTTVLASSSSGTDLFTHIRYMMFTTVPSISVALVVFLVASLMHNPDAVPSTAEYSDALRSTFRISPLLLIVPIFTFFLIIKKVPAILTLMVSAFVAGLAALLFQPGIVASIGGSDVISTGACIKGMMMSWFAGTSVDTGSELVNTLTATRGMGGMLNTVFLIICAVTFGAAMTGSGMFQGITEALTRHIRRRVPSVAATVTTGIVSNVITADQYLSIILSASLFKDLYRKNSLESRLLSRSVEDSATVCSVLIPWNSCGMTQATVLGVATVVYFPYCIFNIVSPLMSILVAAIGSRKKPQVSKSV
ncbi:MAG: sodium:proton antiporter [Bacteroidales bacterium]|nr:sodium:proton antiporter [Bacteroidales bacterium]MCI5482408.1 sodium:proton antiporter [Bacteroidales bacterium]MDD6751125.1 Na+/H+ antiporter NhaC family protein [Bacteroidales bacterium]MDY2879075.1 Na+/H+ antiporter NhaC family protein [Candidatus Cryptobacteroides sp.]